MLAVWIQQLSPFIPFTHHLGRWYGLAYLLGFVCGYYVAVGMARRKELPIAEEKVADLVLCVAIFGVLLGGRLGYVLFYQPGLIIQFNSHIPFWGVLRVNEGGMSAHGGIIGVVLALSYFAWKNKVPIIRLGDVTCMTAPIGIFFGRIANFINGELWGHVTNVPWAVKFPQELVVGPSSHLERTVSLAQKADLLVSLSSQGLIGPLPDVDLTQLPNLIEHNDPDVIRLLEQVIQLAQQHNGDVLDRLANILPARHPSQLYEALMEGLLLFLICWTVGRLWKKPGMASGAFLTSYPIMRIIGEQFRVGDDPDMRGFGNFNLLGHHYSLGILYSIPMFIAGLIFWIYWIRKPISKTSPELPGLAAK